MNEQLSLIKEIIITNPEKEEILKLVRDSYLLNRKYFIFSYFFDQTRKVVNDLESIKNGKISKKSKLINTVLKIDEINENNYQIIKRDILNKYDYYYTAFILNNLIKKENTNSLLKYLMTMLLTIISVTLTFIATLISKK